ncbi:MAG: FkbM family methyltransferase [Pseudomonadota bacterium]
MDNPWITQACEQHDVPPNRLDTHLQEQYGQLGEDLVLDALLKSYFHRHGLEPDRIRYLEIGANHPVQTSNTYLFHNKWGGKGILVEANAALVPALKRVRTRDVVLNYAVVPAGQEGMVTLNVAENPELSSLDKAHVESFGEIGGVAGTREVEALTLDELLDNCFPEGLHLMSIDIEGLDLPVLEGAAFRRRPVFIVAEPSRHYFDDAEQSFARVLTQQRYVEVARTDFNIIYLDRAVGLDG